MQLDNLVILANISSVKLLQVGRKATKKKKKTHKTKDVVAASSPSIYVRSFDPNFNKWYEELGYADAVTQRKGCDNF